VHSRGLAAADGLPRGVDTPGLPDHGETVWTLTSTQALALGLLHGPTELLPVSSSAHTFLASWLSGLGYQQLDGGLRKSFEVALHAGAVGGLLLAYRDERTRIYPRPTARWLAMMGLALAPPAVSGYLLQEQIEETLSSPAPIAAGLALGGSLMALADRRGVGRRVARQAGPVDGLLLGLGQALALAPGVSRNGATLTVARARGFTPREAQRLSWQVGLPVIAGASLLRCAGLAREGLPAGAGGTLVTGAAGAFASGWLAARLTDPLRRGRSLTPYALYRAALATVTLAEIRRRSAGLRRCRPASGR
jgi:undecaprenyl-diphosphatase